MRPAALTAALLALSSAAAHAQTAPTLGPCEQAGNIGAIVDRPGLGRPTANNGSPCVVPLEHFLLETGYRNQTTGGNAGTSTLEVFPLALTRVGVGSRTEIVLQVPAQTNRGGASLGGTFVPASGTQDAGFGFKRMLDDRAAFQDAVQLFYTAPTGTQGPNGFSAGTPTYMLTYTAAVPINSRLGISITQSAVTTAQFTSYQPSATLSYGFAPNFTVLASDQITTPLSAAGGTGNRALFAVQRVVSPGIVVDAEYELNALPAAPAVRQNAFGIGAAVEF